MQSVLIVQLPLAIELLLSLKESEPLSHGFHLIGETAAQPDTQSPRLTGDWQKRENTEHSDTEDDVKLHELMEDIKRYIRSIDVSNL